MGQAQVNLTDEELAEAVKAGWLKDPAVMGRLDSDSRRRLSRIAPESGGDWTANHPYVARGARMALDTLPGVGAMVGGMAAVPLAAMSTPVGAPFVEMAGAGLGAGAGRGARDLIAEATGLDAPSTPLDKAGRIGIDTTETAALSAVLPGLVAALRTPGRTVGEMVDMLPAALRTRLRAMSGATPPSGPGAVHERPAWQTWADNVPPTSPGETAAGGTPPPSGPPPSPAPGAPRAKSPQQILNEEALARRRAEYQARQTAPVEKPALSAVETKEYLRLRVAGKTDEQARAVIAASRGLNQSLNLKTPTPAETKFPKGNRGAIPKP